MDVKVDQSKGFEKARSHPFVATRPGEAGFVDFKQYPEQIHKVLEDFCKLGYEPAIQGFYRFLGWLNGPDSLLESCDCALRGPDKNKFNESKRALSLHGRLMLMHRDLSANCDDRFNSLFNTMGRGLSSIDLELTQSQGTVTLAASKALFLDLIPNEHPNASVISNFGDPGRGYQLLLHFKAFGNSSDEAFENLDRVFKNIEMACKRASENLKVSQ